MRENWQDILKNVQAFDKTLPKQPTSTETLSFSAQSYSDDVIPFELYRGTRGNIEKICNQINQSFHYGIYDGCAVLMRRLTEMLLILSFKNHNLENNIRDSDNNYLPISDIVKKAINDKTLDLSRGCKNNLNQLIEKGHLSAHSPFYNALKKDIEVEQLKFRQVVEELLHKAGIIT